MTRGVAIAVDPTPQGSTVGSSNQTKTTSGSSRRSSSGSRPAVPIWVPLTAGGIAGATSRTLTAPLDRVKVLLQEGRITVLASSMHPTVQVPPDSKVNKVELVVRHIYNEGGLTAFWRGNGANCVKAGPEFALVFSIRGRIAAYLDRCREYNRLLSELEAANKEGQPLAMTLTSSRLDEISGSPWFKWWATAMRVVPTWLCNVFSGAVAGGAAQTILYPLEVVKTRMAVGAPGEYLGIGDCIKQSFARGGVREFYKGLSANLVGIIPYRGLEVGMFFTFQQSLLTAKEVKQAKLAQLASTSSADPNQTHSHRHHPSKPTLSAIEVAALGTVSGIVAQTVTYPLNLVRTRLQTQGVNGRPLVYTGMIHCFQTILATDGVRGLFNGLGANFLKAVPASATTFVVYDRAYQLLSQVKL